MSLSTDAPWKLFVFSGIGSCTAELSTVPIDVVKVRLQLQGELGAVRKYHSSLHAARTIVAEEGARALYKGVAPALLRQATYGAMRIGAYEPAKRAFGVEPGKDVALYQKMLAGCLSGGVSAAICTPADVIKVRMQADGMHAKQGAPPRYSGLANAFVTIFRTEGLTGLYKGVSPTTQRAAIVAATELATYDECKQILIRRAGFHESRVTTHLSAATMAGFLATVTSSPADVIKSRMMNQPCGPDGRGTVYSSTLDCLRKSVRAEGVRSLWKGFVPNFARIGPHTTIMFLVIERLRHWFSVTPA